MAKPLKIKLDGSNLKPVQDKGHKSAGTKSKAIKTTGGQTAKALQKADLKKRKQKLNQKAKDKWRGLLPKIKRINQNLEKLEEDPVAIQHSVAYETVQSYATSGKRVGFFDNDTEASRVRINVTNFQDFKKLSPKEQTEFKKMIEDMSEYKTLTVRGAKAAAQRKYETFKKNREKKPAIDKETGQPIEGKYKRNKSLSRDQFENFFTQYNMWKEKHGDHMGSELIDYLRNNFDIEKLTDEQINSIFDYANADLDKFGKTRGLNTLPKELQNLYL